MTPIFRLRIFSVAALTLFLAAVIAPVLVRSHDNRVEFHLTDEPASWYKNAGGSGETN